MKTINNFKEEIAAFASGKIYGTFNGYVVYILASCDSIQVKVARGKKNCSPFVEAFGECAATHDDGNGEVLFMGIDYLVYSTRYEKGGTVFTAVLVSQEYAGNFEKSGLPDSVIYALLERKRQEDSSQIIKERTRDKKPSILRIALGDLIHRFVHNTN